MASSATTTTVRSRTALVTAVIVSLAIAAPVARANAPTAPTATAVGPTLIGDVFNGGTTIVTSPGSATGTTISTP